MKVIAHIHTDFKSKFGVPRQAGLVDALEGKIVFEPSYRVADALRGLDGFSHLWLIWDFSEAHRDEWSPTVRPPRLGGNQRMGVFATRSPFRPNPIGISSVEISRIELNTPDGPIIYIKGADLMDGTPIYDIKPYIPYADSIPDAAQGFTAAPWEPLEVRLPSSLPPQATPPWLLALKEVLAQDPRPAHQDDPNRDYHLILSPLEVTFRVQGNVLTVTRIAAAR